MNLTMWLRRVPRRWLGNRPSAGPRRRKQRVPQARRTMLLQLEDLEQRLTPSNVFNVANGDVTGLINAINFANKDTSPDTINLAAHGTYTLDAVNNTSNGQNGLPAITATNLTINGNGAAIQRSAASGTPFFRIMEIDRGTTTLNDVTISGGNLGTVLSHSTIGGGIDMEGGALNLTNSTVSGNSTADLGGGLEDDSLVPLTIVNSTIANNSGLDGVHIDGSALVENSTITNNSSTDIISVGTITLINSIVGVAARFAGTMNATNTLIQNLAPGTVNGTNVNNIFLANPQLGPLQNNGGDTDTLAITTNSPAFAAGNSFLLPSDVVTDQRGFSRAVNGQLDMGAFEIQAGIVHVSPVNVPFSSASQKVTLSATVAAANLSTVNEGRVTFNVLGQTLTTAVSNGVASTTLTIPGGTALGAYPMSVLYSDSSPDPGNLRSFAVASSLTVASAPVTTTAVPQPVFFNAASQPFTLTATVTDPANTSNIVNEGSVAFTIEDSGGHVVGIPVSAPVVNGQANASYIVPPALVPGAYYFLIVSYKDAAGHYSDGGDQNNILTVNPAVVTTASNPTTATIQAAPQTIALSAFVKDQSFPNSTVNEGAITFSVLDGNGNLVGVPVQGAVTNGLATAAFVVPAGLPAGTYTIKGPYSDPSGNFLYGGGVPNTLMIIRRGGSVRPGSVTPASSTDPPVLSQQQALFQLFLDGFELEMETLLGQSTAATQADINNLLPLAGSLASLFELAGQLALSQAFRSQGSA